MLNFVPFSYPRRYLSVHLCAISHKTCPQTASLRPFVLNITQNLFQAAFPRLFGRNFIPIPVQRAESARILRQAIHVRSPRRHRWCRSNHPLRFIDPPSTFFSIDKLSFPHRIVGTFVPTLFNFFLHRKVSNSVDHGCRDEVLRILCMHCIITNNT